MVGGLMADIIVWIPIYDRLTMATHWYSSSKDELDKLNGLGRVIYYSEPERGGYNIVHEKPD